MEQLVIKYLVKYVYINDLKQGFIDLENQKILENEIQKNNNIDSVMVLDFLKNNLSNKRYLMCKFYI